MLTVNDTDRGGNKKPPSTDQILVIHFNKNTQSGFEPTRSHSQGDWVTINLTLY